MHEFEIGSREAVGGDEAKMRAHKSARIASPRSAPKLDGQRAIISALSSAIAAPPLSVEPTKSSSDAGSRDATARARASASRLPHPGTSSSDADEAIGGESGEETIARAPRATEGSFAAALDPTSSIVLDQVWRRYLIRSRGRLTNAAKAYARNVLGYSPVLPAAEGKRISNEAAAIVDAVAKDREADHVTVDGNVVPISSMVVHRIGRLMDAREIFDRDQDEIEAAMAVNVKSLPEWTLFAKSVRGISEMTLAVIIGESCTAAAPTIGSYRSAQNFCKRLGWGVVDGRRQGAPGPGAKADDWTRHGHSKTRQAQIFGAMGVGFFTAQSSAVKKKTGEVRDAGPYRLIYDRVKADETAANERGEFSSLVEAIRSESNAKVSAATRKAWDAGKLTPGHIHNRALRRMIKAFLEDLWGASRRAKMLATERSRESAPSGEILDTVPLRNGKPQEAVVFAPSLARPCPLPAAHIPGTVALETAQRGG